MLGAIQSLKNVSLQLKEIMKFKVIASGSKGNMIYIETNECKVLLDCGITYKNSKLELINDGVNIDDVELILCTHEHTDHVKELLMHMKKTNATLYINEKRVHFHIIDKNNKKGV